MIRHYECHVYVEPLPVEDGLIKLKKSGVVQYLQVNIWVSNVDEYNQNHFLHYVHACPAYQEPTATSVIYRTRIIVQNEQHRDSDILDLLLIPNPNENNPIPLLPLLTEKLLPSLLDALCNRRLIARFGQPLIHPALDQSPMSLVLRR